MTGRRWLDSLRRWRLLPWRRRRRLLPWRHLLLRRRRWLLLPWQRRWRHLLLCHWRWRRGGWRRWWRRFDVRFNSAVGTVNHWWRRTAPPVWTLRRRAGRGFLRRLETVHNSAFERLELRRDFTSFSRAFGRHLLLLLDLLLLHRTSAAIAGWRHTLAGHLTERHRWRLIGRSVLRVPAFDWFVPRRVLAIWFAVNLRWIRHGLWLAVR